MQYAILGDHFDLSDTLIVGDYIRNGCQLFHIDDMDKVCDEFNVGQKLRDQVRALHASFERDAQGNLAFYNAVHCDDANIVALVAANGYELDMLSEHNSWLVKLQVAKHNIPHHNAVFVNDDESMIREQVAINGYGLDILVNDSCWNVRAQVAAQGFGLDKLVNDSNPYVRRAVAAKGFGLVKLIKDEDIVVRREVAAKGFGLDKLINDPSPDVRAEVAKNGYGLEILIGDRYASVRWEVLKRGYKLEESMYDDNTSLRCMAIRVGIQSENPEWKAMAEKAAEAHNQRIVDHQEKLINERNEFKRGVFTNTCSIQVDV